jgi:hypothetical protein
MAVVEPALFSREMTAQAMRTDDDSRAGSGRSRHATNSNSVTTLSVKIADFARSAVISPCLSAELGMMNF